MSESLQHQLLVNRLIEASRDIVGIENDSFICVDSSDQHQLPPQTKEGFRPDLYYEYNGVLLIGEAKTSADVEREHSLKQYKSYINKCVLFSGEATLLVAVSWIDKATICNILKRIMAKYSREIKIIVLEEII